MSRIQWDHVLDLNPIQRNRRSEVRARIVRSRQGYGLELRIAFLDDPIDARDERAPTIVLYADRLDQALLSIDNAQTLIRDMERGHSHRGRGR